jgi:predicted Co/Zn/Cd cation transporter (cation efflux family)
MSINRIKIMKKVHKKRKSVTLSFMAVELDLFNMVSILPLVYMVSFAPPFNTHVYSITNNFTILSFIAPYLLKLVSLVLIEMTLFNFSAQIGSLKIVS